MTFSRLIPFAGSPAGTHGFDDGTGTDASFDCPTDLVASPDGSILYVVDHGNRAIRAIDVATAEVSTLCTFPSDRRPVRAAVGQTSGNLYVTVWATAVNFSTVARVTPAGVVDYLLSSDPTGSTPGSWYAGGLSSIDVEETETWAVVKWADTRNASSFTNRWIAWNVASTGTGGPTVLYAALNGHFSPYTPTVWNDGAYLDKFGEGVCYLPVDSYYQSGVIDDSTWDIPAPAGPQGMFAVQYGYVGPSGNGWGIVGASSPPDFGYLVYSTYTSPVPWEISRSARSIRRYGTGELLIATNSWVAGSIWAISYNATPQTTTTGFPIDTAPETADLVCSVVTSNLIAAESSGGLVFGLLTSGTAGADGGNRVVLATSGGWKIGEIGLA